MTSPVWGQPELNNAGLEQPDSFMPTHRESLMVGGEKLIYLINIISNVETVWHGL